MAAGTPDAWSADPSVAIVNGVVWTADSTRPWAEAIAINGDRILAVDGNDVTGKTVVACREAETTSLGAGMQAAAAAGWYGSVREAAEAMSGVGARHTPDAAAAARYDELFAVYREIYPRTAPLHEALERATHD